ncbi:TPA: hypothetical protein ACGTP6_000904 [Legionella pneumophila]|uniref:hypothetical protein n=1 Tax=Legionella pneumophila TaxID=446 RepID=UPI001A34AE84|nr:hypothetical protein [Legionella pneumophila]MCZ4682188.1 hypothetical protein [Legionella pneumophila]HAU0949082.1 hypothetical protein [Legionella pneumophila]HAU1288288.1 hypothetical protein [Legionella pneumophila]
MEHLRYWIHNFSFKDFCDLLLGLGTFLIGVMGYKLSRKEFIPLIKASLNNIFYAKPGSNTIHGDQHALAISAYNAGKREIQVTGVQFKYYKYPFSKGIILHDVYILKSEYPFSTKLPCSLKDGDSLILVYPPDIFQTYRFQDEVLFHDCFLVKFFRVIFLKIYLCTSIEHKVKVKFSLKMKRQIIKSLR